MIASTPSQVVTILTRYWQQIAGNPCLDELSALRGYNRDHPFYSNPPELSKVTSPPAFLSSLPQEVGLVDFTGRWVTPIRLPDGRVCALVGWSPDGIKYLTSPSRVFSRSLMLLGIHNVSQFSSPPLVVEGVMDYLACTSVGIPCVSLMGAKPSREQRAQLAVLARQYGKVVGVPDRDALQSIHQDVWQLPHGSGYFCWDHSIPGKDLDDVIALMGTEFYSVYVSAVSSSDFCVRLSL